MFCYSHVRASPCTDGARWRGKPSRPGGSRKPGAVLRPAEGATNPLDAMDVTLGESPGRAAEFGGAASRALQASSNPNPNPDPSPKPIRASRALQAAQRKL